MKKIKNLSKYKGNYCRNCGFKLHQNENFCPNCGQKNDIRRANIKIFWKTFLDSIFSFDHKGLTTIKELFISPAKISLNYIKGKKIRYLNPFRFLLNLSILFFLLMHWVDNQSAKDSVVKSNNITKTTIRPDRMESLYFNKLKNFIEYNHLDKVFKNDSIPDSQKLNLYKQFLVIKYSKIPDSISIPSKKNIPLDSLKPKEISRAIYNIQMFHNYFSQKHIKLDFEPIHDTIQEMFNDLSWYSKMLFFGRISKINRFSGLKPSEVLDSLHLSKSTTNMIALKMGFITDGNNKIVEDTEQNFYTYFPFSLFLFLPFFTLIMLAAFGDDVYNYTEQLIFVFNLQSIFFVFLIIEILLGFFVKSKWLIFFPFILFAWYLFVSLKQFYSEGGFKTLIKMLFFIIPTYFFLAWISFILITLILVII